MQTAERNHYDVLGIPRTASDDEIKRAWARLVRLHTPDKDPEGNRRINEAKQTLLSPRGRSDYDSLLDYGEEIEELLEEAELAEEDEDWEEAIRAYKEILAFHPNNGGARNRLALCQAQNEDFVAALHTLEVLLAKEGDVAVYWSNYGHFFIGQAGDADRPDLFRKAEQAFKKARELEPHNAEHSLSLSRLSRRQKDFVRAEAYVEDAIKADGKIDIDDIETLFELAWIHLFAGQLNKLSADAERIRSLIPAGYDEALEFASHKFYEIANQLAENDNHKEAAEFVNAGMRLKPLTGDLAKWADALRRNGRIIVQFEKLEHDTQLLEAVKVVARLLVGLYFSWIEFEEEEHRFNEVHDALRTWSNSEVCGSFARLRSNYRDIYDINPKYLGDLASLGYGANSYSASASTSSSGGSWQQTSTTTGGGCVLPLIGILTAVAAFIFAVF